MCSTGTATSGGRPAAPPARRGTAPERGRFVEITVNGPRWSLGAALRPDVAAAYDAAQDRVAEAIIDWLAPAHHYRDRTRGLSVDSRCRWCITMRRGAALHLPCQGSAPPPARAVQRPGLSPIEQWRGLLTIRFRDSTIEVLKGIGYVAVLCDPGFGALAAAGFTLDHASGEVA